MELQQLKDVVAPLALRRDIGTRRRTDTRKLLGIPAALEDGRHGRIEVIRLEHPAGLAFRKDLADGLEIGCHRRHAAGHEFEELDR